MRYQELREGRSHLESALRYLTDQFGGADCIDMASFPELVILGNALRLVRLELNRPDGVNTDGSPRMIPMFDNSGGAKCGTTPPEPVDIATASRQVRRAIARVVGFNQISFPCVSKVDGEERTGRVPMMPRSDRRRLAKKARLDRPKVTNVDANLPAVQPTSV